MIVLDCEQGSRAWEEARLGIPTASCFARIVTPGGKLSKSREGYRDELLVEWAFGEGSLEFETEWSARGKALEPQARDFYSFVRSAEVRSIGLAYRDESRSVAASPDGLVGDCGLLELKCPMPKTHLGYLAGNILPRDYVLQVQGQLWVTGRGWVDFMSYCPNLPPFIVRVEPDLKIQVALDAALPAFTSELEAGRARLIELGVQPWKDAIRDG